MSYNIDAWKVNDHDWLKRRKNNWSILVPKLKRAIDLKGVKLSYLKSFYLFGKIDIDKLSEDLWGKEVSKDRPFEYFDAPVLLECWLTADQSDNNWQNIKKKYRRVQFDDSRVRFNNVSDFKFRRLCTNGGSFFNGLENRLYNLFYSNGHFTAGDHPEWRNNDMMIEGKPKHIAYLINSFIEYFELDPPNPFFPARFRVQEWKEILTESLDLEFMSTRKLENYVRRILLYPSKYPSDFVGFAVELNHVLQNFIMTSSGNTELQDEIREAKENEYSGITIELYVICKSKKTRDQLFSTLDRNIRPLLFEKKLPTKELHLIQALSKVNYPQQSEIVDKLGFIAIYYLGPAGFEQLQLLVDEFKLFGATSFYITFDDEKRKKLFYEVIVPKYSSKDFLDLNRIYQVGDDKTLDQKIASCKNKVMILPSVVCAKK